MTEREGKGEGNMSIGPQMIVTSQDSVLAGELGIKKAESYYSYIKRKY